MAHFYGCHSHWLHQFMLPPVDENSYFSTILLTVLSLSNIYQWFVCEMIFPYALNLHFSDY